MVRAEAASLAALACAEVVRLHPGPFGEVATLGPGERVPGVRIDGNAVEVHVVARYGIPLRQVANRVRAAVARTDTVADASVHVVIADIEDEDD